MTSCLLVIIIIIFSLCAVQMRAFLKLQLIGIFSHSFKVLHVQYFGLKTISKDYKLLQLLLDLDLT